MAIGSENKYTKEQRRKAKYIEDSDEEAAVSHKKTEHIARTGKNKQSGADDLTNEGTATSEWQKKTVRKDSAKNAVKNTHALAEPTALEQQPIDVLRKKARKKHISGSSSMTQLELIHALRSR
ncbi:hypothetical protein [Rheinheimera sp. 1928-s]|uniref:hypothetical protein n=1 Tax=Rheinheimera sp. 1928-s TaxID=3033803 RepID=UPI002621D513|nr:hypothetical protein [Rheinheimera sp. 1928-s]MDF3127161.1 hypothetical protein [Rheinheimera sp. 1928-s]